MSATALFGLAGCNTAAPTSVQIDLKYTAVGAPKPVGASSKQVVRSCVVFLATVTDDRTDKSYFGSSNGLSVKGGGAEAWVRDGVKASLVNTPANLSEAAPAPAEALQLKVRVLKAYTSSINNVPQTAVVVQVGFSRDGSDLGHEIYRGQSTPFWGGLEYGLNQALDRALTRFATDVSSRCKTG